MESRTIVSSTSIDGHRNSQSGCPFHSYAPRRGKRHNGSRRNGLPCFRATGRPRFLRLTESSCGTKCTQRTRSFINTFETSSSLPSRTVLYESQRPMVCRRLERSKSVKFRRSMSVSHVSSATLKRGSDRTQKPSSIRAGRAGFSSSSSRERNLPTARSGVRPVSSRTRSHSRSCLSRSAPASGTTT